MWYRVAKCNLGRLFCFAWFGLVWAWLSIAWFVTLVFSIENVEYYSVVRPQPGADQ